MQQATESAPSAAANSFAGLLASLTAPKSGVPGDRSSSHGWKKSASDWNDDELADDAVTLSYENALRTHARYRAPDLTDCSVTQPASAEAERIDSYELASIEEAPRAQPEKPTVPLRPAASGASHGARSAPTPFQRNLKSASITIRLSKEEAAQLHRRAAEAGLTVSGYLRSCTFEAESLRAMVKDTMTQLKAATSPVNQATPRRSSLGRRLCGLFTPWRSQRRMANA